MSWSDILKNFGRGHYQSFGGSNASIKRCDAHKCVWNKDSKCKISITVDDKGQCLEFNEG